MSQPVQASFSQSEEVFYSSHITKHFGRIRVISIKAIKTAKLHHGEDNLADNLQVNI